MGHGVGGTGGEGVPEPSKKLCPRREGRDTLGVHLCALLPASFFLRGPRAADPRKGEGVGAATLAEAKWTG